MTKLVALTVAALLFRLHYVKTGQENPLSVVTTREDVLNHPWGNTDLDFSFVTHALGLSRLPFEPDEGYLPAYATLMRKVEIKKDNEHFVSDPPDPPGDYKYRTDTNELEWYYDPESTEDCFFKADTEKVHVLAGAIDRHQPHTFTRGLLAGGSIGDITLTSSALIAVILIETTEYTNKYLIIATGEIENTNFQETEVQPQTDPRTYYLAQPEHWGHAPVLVEGIDAYITIPVSANNVEWYALNPQGNRIGDPLPKDVLERACGLRLLSQPDQQTLWYELVITLVG